MLNFEYNWDNLLKITKTLSHRKRVILALYCAELTKLTEKDQICINLIKQWLDNPEAFTQDQLLNAAYASWTTYYTAWAAIANATDNATRAVYSAKFHKSKILPYLDALTKDIPKTPYTDPFEIIVYLQDQLEYPILDGNRLNLWNSQYEYQITGSIVEIANTLGIKNLLNTGE